VAELAAAGHAIRTQVALQREVGTRIETAARDSAGVSQIMAGEIGGIVEVVSETATLSDQVSRAATGLSRTARDLQSATDLFVRQLKNG
jgi:methyl-accepting chemotaxis protein